MDVGAWLEAHGLGRYREVFASNDIDGELLRGLTADDLKELGVASLGHRKKLLAAIAALDAQDGSAPLSADAAPEIYTPRHLAERILGARAALEGERKQVTVLFADVKGSLALIEHADPEDARRLLDAALAVMMDGVHRYEGTVNRVLGDGIMALFGAPITHEDHAVRACYAALAIQRAMRAQADQARASHGVEVSVRIGLNSGEVLVRAIGNDLSIDYDAIGSTVHLANRMEQLASPGTIRLTAATARLAEGFLDLRSLGQVPVKGGRASRPRPARARSSRWSAIPASASRGCSTSLPAAPGCARGWPWRAPRCPRGTPAPGRRSSICSRPISTSRPATAASAAPRRCWARS
jgi:class 3 adenylate cyclase